MKQRQLVFPPLLLLLALLAASAPPFPFCSCESAPEAPSNSYIAEKIRRILKKAIKKALQENPGLSIPGVKLHESSSLDEKAAAIALAIAGKPIENINKFLGGNEELLRTIQEVMTQKDKVSQAKALQSYLEGVATQITALLKGQKHVDCEKLKEEGVTPEVRLGHSPLTKFGFPVYDSKSNRPLLERRLSLNLINKFPVGITVGAYDYVIQGRLDKIKKFLQCFSIYGVTAETLFQDGHWYSKPHDGQEPRPVYIQLQAVLKGQSLGDILVRQSLARVLQKVDKLNISKVKVSQLVDQLLDGDTDASELLGMFPTLEMAHQIKQYAAAEGQVFRKLLTEILEAKTLKERIQKLMEFFEKNPGGEEWTQPWVVSNKSNLTLTLTTYPRPDSNVRSTRKMDSNKVTLGDVLDALDEINFSQ